MTRVMYELHVANRNYSSWSLRPWVLMKGLGIDFAERFAAFGSTDFRSFSPSGRVPVLVHDGLRVWDSLAIVEYLAERHPGVWPKDVATRAWARSACAEMHSGFQTLREVCSMNCGLRVKLNEVTPALAKDLERLGALWAEGLGRSKGPFLTGAAFSAVDAFFAPVAFRFLTYGVNVSGPASGYAETLRGLPAMKQWYEAALAETFRDASHDNAVAQYGTVTSDLRAK